MDARCPHCGKKFGRDLVGHIYVWCRECKAEVLVIGQIVDKATIDKATTLVVR